jgi:hypothetical protein
MGMSEKEEINMLRSKVRELSKTVEAQNKLIEIFKSMPSQKRVKEPSVDASLAKPLSKGVHKKSKPVAELATNSEGDTEDHKLSSGSGSPNDKAVEETTP